MKTFCCSKGYERKYSTVQNQMEDERNAFSKLAKTNNTKKR